MSEIGSSLRAARLQQGLELADVERAIRIKARLLEALEEERFELLPGNFYARTFLRGYADFLGLEGEAYAEAYEAGFAEPPPPPMLPPLRLRRVWSPRRALAVLAALAAVAALAVLAFAPSGSQRPVALAPPPPAAHVAASQPHVRAPAPRRPVPVAAAPRLVLTAARGTCWLLVRGGSATGPMLYEGTLQRGRSLSFGRKFLWARVGAPWTLDVRLKGKLLPGLNARGPINLLMTPAGLNTA